MQIKKSEIKKLVKEEVDKVLNEELRSSEQKAKLKQFNRIVKKAIRNEDFQFDISMDGTYLSISYLSPNEDVASFSLSYKVR